MDHNLEESLNLESAMGSMDFEHSGVVVSQSDITLETTGDMHMEFEQIEEQPMLMDTENEEIIVSDFINDSMQEYSVQDDSTETLTASTLGVEANQLNVLTSESMIDLKFEPEDSISHDVTTMPKYIAVKAAAAPTRTIVKKNESAAMSMPRQVAIAPKPAKLTAQKAFSAGKQFTIGPKPVTLVANRSALTKITGGVIQGNVKRGPVLTQIGKQLVMMPAGAQKLKLLPSNSLQYAQILGPKTITGVNTQKSVVAKVIVQGQDTNQPTVITKLLPAPPTAAPPQARYVMQQKTVPISIGNKVLLTSPTKSGMKIGKKQIIAIKSPTSKLLPATSQGTTKKVVITTNPNQNVILKTTAPPKTTQVTKDGSVIVQGQQRTQLHQINVPGKGIQYIRLVTNQTPAAPSKSFVLTDNKGNLIQMTSDKMVSNQPPPLVISSGIGGPPKLTSKPQKKLVRIAPVTSKPSQSAVTQQNPRSAQSLLAPLSPAEDLPTTKLEEAMADILEPHVTMTHDAHVLESDDIDEDASPQFQEQDEVNIKAELRAILNESDNTNDGMHSMQEVEVDFERSESPEEEEDSNSIDQHDNSNRSDEHPLIVIPTNSVKQESQVRVTSESNRRPDDSQNYTDIVSEIMKPYLSPKNSNTQSESDAVSGDMSMRPRKACNCTKSQCLKLYCDCFANGEFCNRCNCNNCHNNLENEELRQKAIRACLDRNPNAFRPKIGKTKNAGPEIIRRHNKGCNCKRSGCLKNYCECYEAKIACTAMCKCVGCRNVEDTLERRREHAKRRDGLPCRPPPLTMQLRQPCSFMTSEVIEAVCQCLIAAAVESGESEHKQQENEQENEHRQQENEHNKQSAPDPVRDVIDEFARCLQDVISASHQSYTLSTLSVLDEVNVAP